jgi:hypothetical protein
MDAIIKEKVSKALADGVGKLQVFFLLFVREKKQCEHPVYNFGRKINWHPRPHHGLSIIRFLLSPLQCIFSEYIVRKINVFCHHMIFSERIRQIWIDVFSPTSRRVKILI